MMTPDEAGSGSPDEVPAADAFAAMDQSSIDGLFGFASVPIEIPSGLNSLVDHNNIPQVRPLILEGLLERSTRMLEGALRKVASDAVEVTLTTIVTTRCRSYLETISLPAMLAIIRTSWGGSFLVVMGADLVYGLIEAMLGGSIKSTAAPIEGRAFTAIETRIARRVIDDVVANMQAVFSNLSPVTFTFDHLEPIPRFIDIARPMSLGYSARIGIRIGELAANLEILIPQSTLDPIQGLLSNSSADDSSEADAGWRAHLRTETLRSEVTLTAQLHEERLPLSRIMNLAVGDTLMFHRRVDEPVELRCGTRPVALAKVGHSGTMAALKVISRTPPAEDGPGI